MCDKQPTITGFDDSPDATAALPGMPAAVPPAGVPNPKADLAALDELERHLFAHRYARIGMECHGGTIDPEAAAADRGEALAILRQEDQALLCSPETGALLDRLAASQALLTPMQAAQVRILQRDRASMVDVPPEVQGAFTRLTNEAEGVWRQARASDDWSSFEPYLDRIVSALREIAHYRDPGADPYDVWLDEHEHGTDRSFYERLFGQVKDVVVPLLADVRASSRTLGRSPFAGRFDASRQGELAHDLLRLEGLDERKVFVTSSEHPFSDGLTSNYVIVAGHVREDDILSNVYTMLHEGGHALYEMGVDAALDRTSLKGGTSMGMHEAQSRFFENHVGRSLAFAPRLIEVMARQFRGQLGRVTPGQLHAATNRVEAQPIRTEADELTYPLHVIVRYEIEQLLMSGEAHAVDVPGLWAERYKGYLGVDVPNDARGALQDTHWAGGMMGYFPAYALGSAIGAQLEAAMVRGGMDFDGVCASGDLSPIHDWLRERIWRHGRSRDTPELVLDACGEPFSPTRYTDYLTKKFSALYNL